MGIGLGRKCKSAPYQTSKAIEPQPKYFSIRGCEQVGNHVIAQVYYPHCTNYEGEEILFFKDYTLEELRARTEIDPHFSRSTKSPFARFKPTKAGAAAAKALAFNLAGGTKGMSTQEKSVLEPSVRQMLEIGKDCGLTTLNEAYSNYMNHYDCFFLIENYAAQYRDFFLKLKDLGFVETKHEISQDGTGRLLPVSVLRDLTIDQALEALSNVSPT